LKRKAGYLPGIHALFKSNGSALFHLSVNIVFRAPELYENPLLISFSWLKLYNDPIEKSAAKSNPFQATLKLKPPFITG
jgi:hypothetical protein